MENRVIVENFYKVGVNGVHSINEGDLGWQEANRRDARSDYPETIFRYMVEIAGFNLLFYWIKDRNFYTIETELDPIEVRRISSNPEWDGVYEFQKAGSAAGPSTCSPGEVLAKYDDATLIWGELCINGVPIGKVLEQSFIVEWD